MRSEEKSNNLGGGGKVNSGEENRNLTFFPTVNKNKMRTVIFWAIPTSGACFLPSVSQNKKARSLSFRERSGQEQQVEFRVKIHG